MIAEAAHGHFQKELSFDPIAAEGYRLNLEFILKKKRRLDDDLVAFAIIYEHQGEPVGFVIMSEGPGKLGDEFWMTAIKPEFRGQGHDKKMIQSILDKYKNKNTIFFARCHPESDVMYNILLKKGFRLAETGSERGTRILIFKSGQ